MRGSAKYGVLFVVSLVATIAYSSYGSIVVSFAYDREVGGHVLNAYEVNTPEAMISELTKAVTGMHRLGLTDDMYSAYFPWERTPDRSMGFQYEYIDQLINRTEAVITWRTLAYSGNTSPEALGDVYEQKMDNLRTFMTEGCDHTAVCSDWIARDVYYIYKATPYYFSSLFGLGSAILLSMSLGLFVFVRIMERNRPIVRRGRGVSMSPGQTAWVRTWIVIPLYVLGLVLLALPYILSAGRAPPSSCPAGFAPPL